MNAVHDKRARSQRGSSLILTVAVMTVLSLLAMSFLLVAETDNHIAVAERDEEQVLYVARSAATLVESWFHAPDPSLNGFVPPRDECDLRLRKGDSDFDGAIDLDAPARGAQDEYRGGTAAGTYRLFDKPYRGAMRDTFWGSADWPDVLLTNDPDVDDEYLDRVSALFNRGASRSLDGVVITEIRVYAPPVDTALKRRFGICTASVTAAKETESGGVRRRLSELEVTIVLQELPFPAPGACVESAGGVDLQGNFGVHWGGSYTESDLSVQQGANFPGPAVPRENTSRNRYANFAPDAPDLDPAVPGIQNLLTQLLGGPAEIRDPWVNFRAAGRILEAPNSDEQPWPYDYSTGLADDRSIFFQRQTYVFPELDYEFWKELAQTRTRNAHYFKYAGAGPVFRKDGVGTAHSFAHWVNTENPGVEPGIFFFDTVNSQNPQRGGAGILTDDIIVSAGQIDSPNGQFVMEGLIYANATLVQTGGLGNHAVTRTINMPAEPYLDNGIDIDRNGVVGNTWQEAETVGNDIWDYAFAGSTESDGQKYDEQYGSSEFSAFEASHRVGDGVVTDAGDDPRVWPDVVHEPFLNLRYPQLTGPTDRTFSVDYDYEATVARPLGGDRDGNGQVDRMTSLRDIKGAQANLAVALNGIWYNEGGYDGDGNLPIYGSMLMKAGFDATGTPDIYFNEAILRGDWPPQEMNMPRVYVSKFDDGR